MATASADYPNLFSEIDIGAVRLRNRIVHLATLTQHVSGHRVTEALVNYHRARAQGGVAMSIVEGLAVHPSSVPLRSVITLFDDGASDGLKRLAAAGEAHDCRMLGQLWHVGRQQLWSPIDSPVGVSDQPDAYSWTVPHVLSVAEIRELIDAFVAAAKRLQDCGFSGAELHGAHGYLITQFLSPWSNTRDDDYGGDTERRLRFVTEITEGIRATCGDGFVVGLKMPAYEGVPGGIDGDEAERVTRALVAFGKLDYLAFSQGNFSLSLEDHVPNMQYQPGPFLALHERLRKVAGGLPVMAIGRVMDADHGERVLAQGQADLIGMCRALIADPALPRKAREGRAGETRPCIFCSLCWGETHLGKPLLCIHNPKIGEADEADWTATPAAPKKRIAVVGAGPAGLETAWVAAARGHEVTLFSAGAEVGGALRLDGRLPGRAEVAKVYNYQLRQAVRHGVSLRSGVRATADDIAAVTPDVVVLATGGRQRPPAGMESDAPMQGWRDLVADLTASEDRRAGTAVLFDMDHTDPTYAFLDLLAARYEKAVVLTPRVQLARQSPYTNALGIYRRIYAAGVDIVTAAQPKRLSNGVLTYANAFTGDEVRIDDVALFTYSTPRTADDALAAPLAAMGFEVRLIGDARAPRSIFSAIHEGFHTGNEL